MRPTYNTSRVYAMHNSLHRSRSLDPDPDQQPRAVKIKKNINIIFGVLGQEIINTPFPLFNMICIVQYFISLKTQISQVCFN